jgi:uncharacterized protein CbrC (UPF0167 family)
MEIIRSTKKAGVHTNKIDPEPYFHRWQSCIPLGSVDQKELVGQPCYQHKTCRHLVKIPPDRIPPKVCPWCNVDTVKEQKHIEEAEAQGIKIFDGPEQKLVPKGESLGFANEANNDENT